MNRLKLLPLLLLGGQTAYSQSDYPFEAAIIRDSDGYTNVREAADGHAGIIRRLPDNEPFWYNTTEYDGQQEWISVEIAASKTSAEPSVSGYMHRSRLRPLAALPYQGQDFAFKQTLVPFQRQTHRIGYGTGHEGPVKSIDGADFWGTDGNMPRKETARLEVSISGQQVVIPRSMYRNLYEASPEFTVYKHGDTYFVTQFNSDGAGSYAVVWAFRKAGFVWRLISASC